MDLIYIVEDDRIYREFLLHELSMNTSAEIVAFETGKDCLAELYKMPDMIFLDYDLGDEKGTNILSEIRRFDTEIPVVFESGQSDGAVAANCLKFGGFDYICKDSELDVTFQMVSKMQQISELKTYLRKQERQKRLKKRVISVTLVIAIVLVFTSAYWSV